MRHPANEEDEPENSSDEFISDEESKARTRTLATMNYCYVCGKARSKITQHLFIHRNEEPEVAKLFALPIYSSERYKRLEKLRNKGNFKHNHEVLKGNSREVKVSRRMENKCTDVEQFALCLYCKGAYSRKKMLQHIQRCSSKKPSSTQGARNKVLTLVAAAEASDSTEISLEVKELLSNGKNSEIASLVENDPLLLQVAQHWWHTSEAKVKTSAVAQKLRVMGRLLLRLRTQSICSLEEAIKPQNFSNVVKAVRELAGFNVETNTWLRPIVITKLANSIKNVGDIKYARALKEDADRETLCEAETFMNLCAKEWASSILTKTEAKSTPTVAFIQDVQLLYQCMDETAASAVESLTLYEIPPVYDALLRVTSAQVAVLNKNAAEVSKVTLQSFTERVEAEHRDDADVGQSQLDQILSKHFVKINVKNNKGKKLAVMLTPKLLAAITLLVSKRETCGVHKNNPFLFARPVNISKNYLGGRLSFNVFVNRCSATNKVDLRSVLFHKHILRIFQILSLATDELDQLGKLLGRDIRTDREHYQTPEAAVDVARLLELLSALENGTLEKFNGKSLEEIEFAGRFSLSKPNLFCGWQMASWYINTSGHIVICRHKHSTRYLFKVKQD